MVKDFRASFKVVLEPERLEADKCGVWTGVFIGRSPVVVEEKVHNGKVLQEGQRL